MPMNDGNNMIDKALELAVSSLESNGVPKDDAYVALLIRLWSTVPEDVAKIATMLRDDAELSAVINNEDPQKAASVG